MAISLSFLFMRISSSRLVSVRFVMRVCWMVSVFWGGIIMVAMAVACWSCSGSDSFWLIMRVFQFWFSFTWFVVESCWIMSASARISIIFWAFSWVVWRASAIWFMVCHWLSSKRARSLSSFVDNFILFWVLLMVRGLDVYKGLRFFGLDFWYGFLFSVRASGMRFMPIWRWMRRLAAAIRVALALR